MAPQSNVGSIPAQFAISNDILWNWYLFQRSLTTEPGFDQVAILCAIRTFLASKLGAQGPYILVTKTRFDCWNCSSNPIAALHALID